MTIAIGGMNKRSEPERPGAASNGRLEKITSNMFGNMDGLDELLA